ncbi:MAG TPA: HemK2/MTQ2 family protein methyltransferase [Polyangiaceae bacterium]|nr:HemK2/MTQ2 family protein methyltransferase [Polyangiaceae bacterium]
MRRALWKRLLLLRFQLLDRRRHRATQLETVAGEPILVLSDVFNPKLFWTGAFFAESLLADATLVPPGAAVLDMGTGSGVAAVFAARRARRVLGVDVNPRAVLSARINALMHGVDDRVEVRHGDLFGPVDGERFDRVLFNPPFFRGQPRDTFERAFFATDVVERFAQSLGDHLAPGGQCLLVLSSSGDEREILRAFEARGFACELAAERDVRAEVLRLYRVTPR